MNYIFFFIIKLVHWLLFGLQLYYWILIIRIVSSWFVHHPYQNRFFNIIFTLTDWPIDMARKYFHFMVIQPFDFSIIIVFFALEVIRFLLIKLLDLFTFF